MTDVQQDAWRRTGRMWILHVIGVTAMLTLASCAQQRSPTPTPPTSTSTPRPVSARASLTPTATPRPATETPRPPTVTSTATPHPPTATTAPPSPTPTPTSSPLPPTPSPEPPTPRAAIHAFRADVDVADPGDTITLTWHWSGAAEAVIYHMLPTGQLSEPFWVVGPSGSRQYTISPLRRNADSFILYLHDEQGMVAYETLQVALRCPDVWFFSPAPDICPAGPATVTDGAQQYFEHGAMLWMRAEDRIYVLFSDGQQPRWSVYEDEWHEGEPTTDPAIEPPPDRQQPARGFGLVWRQAPTVRQRLGWAVDQERGYETAVQRSSHYRYSDLYIRAADGGVWKLGPNGSAWAYLTDRQ